MRMNDFVKKWEDFRTQKGYMQRVDPNHPLDFFIGISEKGYDQLALFTEVEPAQLRSSKALEVEKNPRKDGKWATQISSVEKDNQDIFARLCVDLVESSYKCKSEKEGLSKVTARFLAWQKLFATIHDTLPKSVLKGLIGEIQFCFYLMESGLSKDIVLNAWQGPNGADRDFILNDKWFEVKSISTGKDKVTISSLNQLETDILGFLVVVNIDESTKTDSGAISIAAAVSDMRKKLSDAPEAARIFEENLVSIGYLDKKVYEDIFFNIGSFSFYKVNEEFPKIVSNMVPVQVVSAKYDLSISGIDEWKIKEDEVWN